MRIEHENVFCPVCAGHAQCLECADGRTFEAYCEVQDAHQREIDRHFDEARRAQCARPGNKGKAWPLN